MMENIFSEFKILLYNINKNKISQHELIVIKLTTNRNQREDDQFKKKKKKKEQSLSDLDNIKWSNTYVAKVLESGGQKII